MICVLKCFGGVLVCFVGDYVLRVCVVGGCECLVVDGCVVEIVGEDYGRIVFWSGWIDVGVCFIYVGIGVVFIVFIVVFCIVFIIDVDVYVLVVFVGVGGVCVVVVVKGIGGVIVDDVGFEFVNFFFIVGGCWVGFVVVVGCFCGL